LFLRVSAGRRGRQAGKHAGGRAHAPGAHRLRSARTTCTRLRGGGGQAGGQAGSQHCVNYCLVNLWSHKPPMYTRVIPVTGAGGGGGGAAPGPGCYHGVGGGQRGGGGGAHSPPGRGSCCCGWRPWPPAQGGRGRGRQIATRAQQTPIACPHSNLHGCGWRAALLPPGTDRGSEGAQRR
jgi:hypothetical protein